MRYKTLNKIVFRFPAFSFSTILEALNSKAKFVEIISTDRFKEAIYFSSYTLYLELERYLSGQLSKEDMEKVELSLIKYLSRMSYRCTPFGSFASCAVGCLDGVPMTEITDDIKYSFRLDMSYLCKLARFLQNDKALRRKIRYKVNSTVYSVGINYRYISSLDDSVGKNLRIAEFNKNTISKYVLKIAYDFISYERMVDNIFGEFSVKKDDVELYLDQLISKKILISEIEPFVTGEDYLSYLCNMMRDKDIYYYERLMSLKEDLEDLNKACSFDERKIIAEKIGYKVNKSRVKCGNQYLFQLDTIYNQRNIKLYDSILSQLNDCFVMFDKLSVGFSFSLLSDFIDKFIKRYEGREVHLLEALDPDIGLGYGADSSFIDYPLISELKLPFNRNLRRLYSMSPLQELLLRKLSSFGGTGNLIEIFDKDLPENKNKKDLPNTIAAMFKIVKYNAESNSYVLSELRFIGSTAANLLGRFAYCDNDIHDIVVSVAQKEQEMLKDYVLAEIAHLSDYRSGNVISRPFLRDYEISYLVNSFLDGKHVIPVSDLMISVRNNELKLRSKSLNKLVIPRLTTAHNYRYNNSTPVYRFLCDLQSQGLRGPFVFSWGVLEDVLAYFPRVVYKNIILSPEMWKINKKELIDSFGEISIDSLKKFIAVKNIPHYVDLAVGDNRLFIDLHKDVCLKILFKELKKYNSVLISEFIPSEDTFVKKGSKASMMNECIIPLIKMSDEK